jgi:preprotein translocase subunit YajC
LLVMVTLMVIIYFQSRSNKYSQQEKPTLRSGFPLL